MRIFVCHSSQDKPLVNAIIDLLPDTVTSWIDETEILAGMDVKNAVTGAIDSDVDYLVAFVSEVSVKSKWVQFELRRALNHEKSIDRVFVLPVLIDDVWEDFEKHGLSKRYSQMLRRKHYLRCYSRDKLSIRQTAAVLGDHLLEWSLRNDSESTITSAASERESSSTSNQRTNHANIRVRLFCWTCGKYSFVTAADVLENDDMLSFEDLRKDLTIDYACKTCVVFGHITTPCVIDEIKERGTDALIAKSNKGVDGVVFHEELGQLPRKPSFWLDDWFFWFPILKEACQEGEPSPKARVYIKTGWGGDVDYDSESNQLTIPIGVACGFYNQYVEEMEVEASAATAADFTIDDLYRLYALYHNWGIEKEPWLLKVLFQSALEFKFNSLLEFVTSRLDHEEMFAGEFLDNLITFVASGDVVSKAKATRLEAAIREEP